MKYVKAWIVKICPALFLLKKICITKTLIWDGFAHIPEQWLDHHISQEYMVEWRAKMWNCERICWLGKWRPSQRSQHPDRHHWRTVHRPGSHSAAGHKAAQPWCQCPSRGCGWQCGSDGAGWHRFQCAERLHRVQLRCSDHSTGVSRESSKCCYHTSTWWVAL